MTLLPLSECVRRSKFRQKVTDDPHKKLKSSRLPGLFAAGIPGDGGDTGVGRGNVVGGEPGLIAGIDVLMVRSRDAWGQSKVAGPRREMVRVSEGVMKARSGEGEMKAMLR